MDELRRYLDVRGKIISFLRPLSDNASRELSLNISTQSFSAKFR